MSRGRGLDCAAATSGVCVWGGAALLVALVSSQGAGPLPTNSRPTPFRNHTHTHTLRCAPHEDMGASSGSSSAPSAALARHTLWDVGQRIPLRQAGSCGAGNTRSGPGPCATSVCVGLSAPMGEGRERLEAWRVCVRATGWVHRAPCKPRPEKHAPQAFSSGSPRRPLPLLHGHARKTQSATGAVQGTAGAGRRQATRHMRRTGRPSTRRGRGVVYVYRPAGRAGPGPLARASGQPRSTRSGTAPGDCHSSA